MLFAFFFLFLFFLSFYTVYDIHTYYIIGAAHAHVLVAHVQIPEGEELVGFHGGCGGHIHYLAPITLRANGNFFEVGCSNMLLPEPEQNSSLSFSGTHHTFITTNVAHTYKYSFSW